MRILYSGELSRGSTTAMRLNALVELGHDVVSVSTVPPTLPTGLRSFAARAMHKLKRPLDQTDANAKIRAEAERGHFDLLWIDKGLTIRPETIAFVKAHQPGIVVAGYSPDDMANPVNQSTYFLRGLHLYDYYATTKTYGVEELREMGVPHPIFSGNAYDPHTHYPIELTPDEQQRFGCDVGFVGYFETDRANHIAFLAANGVPVRVCGESWRHFARTGRLLQPPQPSIYALDYTKALCGAKINLCFLRKANRDRQTQRSVEIPACGAFMLAERTDEHQELFEEGREAEYFSSPEELLEKVKYYLAHPQERQRIAAAGRRRCLDSGYSYNDRLREILQRIFPVPAGKPCHA